MSDLARSALPDAQSEGSVAIREAGLQGMVSVRGDLKEIAKGMRKATGVEIPERRAVVAKDGVTVAWMSPDEVLILCDHGQADAMAKGVSDALEGLHHLALNVSDARAVFVLEGPMAALKDTLAKVTPADMAALAPGEMRRTRLQQVAAAIWFEGETEARVICFRSVAQYVFDLLSLSAKHGGEVGYH